MVKAKDENKVQEKKEVMSKTEPKGSVIYVGPPVKGTIIHSTFTIFSDGIPKEYRQHPIFNHLFVTPEKLDQARKEIGKAGSFRNIYYKRAIEETIKKVSDK